MSRGILLIDHGSRREEANRQLNDIAERFAQSLSVAGERALIECAHMELAPPDIAAGFAACVERGATHIVAIPCMLSRGRHVTEDLPRLLSEASRSHPGVTYSLAAPLSELPGFLALLREAAESG